MKKNTSSPIKKEQTAKRARAQRPVRRETKEVLAELVEKLRGTLELKATTSASQAEAGPRGELSPNLDRLTVGLDLGDQWSHFCILGLQGETLSEGQVQTRQAEVAEFFQALPAARVVGMIEKRVIDGSVLRLIGKWIKVGVIEDGRLLVSETGTGQGQPISPLLANIFL